MDLENLVSEGKFREDLYYRINTVHINLPPLRERPDDIVPLAEVFLKDFAEKYHRPLTGLEPSAAEVLRSHRWSGNIRELQNCIEKAVILSEKALLSAKDIEIESPKTGSSFSGVRALNSSDEEAALKDAIRRTGGNISAAAKMLGISRPTLYAKLRTYGIDKVSYMMDALEDGELNFRFRENKRFNRTLNRIRTIFERQRQKNEQDSWTKLIRVLTHEIMNTVSPIASLSDALASSVDEEGKSELDLKAGLETISDSSRNLIKFVETYRQLSGVARPVRKAVLVQEMMDKVIELDKEFILSCGATCSFVPLDEDIVIYADEGQISQIFINLVKNALQSGAKNILIKAKIDPDDDVIIRVSNDGEPIPTEVQEQIFIPFFTTKKEGSGIGLSISRQIMRNHGGSIELVQSDFSQTVFEIRFP